MSIEARLSINNEEFKKGIKDAEKQTSQSMKKMSNDSSKAGDAINKISSEIQNLGGTSGVLGKVTGYLSKMGPVGIAVGAAIAAVGTAIFGVFKGVGALAGKLDQFAKTANGVNMSTNAYLSLERACRHAGIEMERMMTIVNKLDIAVRRSRAGEKSYADALYSIGVSWRELEKLSPERRIMRVNEALINLRKQGKDIPAAFANTIAGEEDMRVYNQASSQENFNKSIAEASALGYEISDEMIKAAEAYNDSLSDVNSRFLAMASNLEDIEKITKTLTKFWDNIGNKIGGATGIVKEIYLDKFEGIGNAGIELLKTNSNELHNEEIRTLLKQFYHIKDPTGSMPSANALKDYEKKISKMSRDELNTELEKYVKDTQKYLERDKGGGLKKALFNIVKEIDPRFKKFDYDNQSTWVVAKDDEQKSPKEEREELEYYKALDRAEAINRQLDISVKANEDIKIKSGQVVDIEEEILKIERQLQVSLDDRNAKLSEQVKYQLRVNAALANQKVIEAELLKLSERKMNTQNNFYAEMFGEMGANKDLVRQLYTSLKQVTGKDFSLNNETFLNKINKEHIKINNPQLENESDEAYEKRLNTLPTKGITYKSINNFLKDNPDAFFTAFKSLANNFSENKIENPKATPEALARLHEKFIQVTKSLDVENLLPADFNLKSTDTEQMKKNYTAIKFIEQSYKVIEKGLDEQYANLTYRKKNIDKRIDEIDTEKKRLEKRLLEITDNGKDDRFTFKPNVQKGFKEIYQNIKAWEYGNEELNERIDIQKKNLKLTNNKISDVEKEIDRLNKIIEKTNDKNVIKSRDEKLNEQSELLDEREAFEAVIMFMEDRLAGGKKVIKTLKDVEEEVLNKFLPDIKKDEGSRIVQKLYKLEGEKDFYTKPTYLEGPERPPMESPLYYLEQAMKGHIGYVKNRKDEIKKELENLNNLESLTPEQTNKKSDLEEELKDVQSKIDKYTNNRKELLNLINESQKIFGSAEVIENIKDANKQEDTFKIVKTTLALRKEADALNDEISLLDARNKKNEEYVTLLRKQQMLKKAGIDPTKENLEQYGIVLDEVIKKQDALENAKNMQAFKEKLSGQIQENTYNIMEMQAMKREADRLRATNDAKDTLKRDLNPEEIALITRMSDLQFTISQLASNKPMMNEAIYTNELSQRGGFSSSTVVAENPITYEQKIIDYSKKLNGLTHENNRLLERINNKL